MSNSNEIAELQDILRLQKGLQDITNSVHAAKNIKQIVTDSRSRIMELFQVEAAHIYVIDNQDKKEIVTIAPTGDQLKERKIQISNQTIPGYVAGSGKMINIADIHDEKELKKLYPDLMLDSRVDTRFGVKIKQVMALPITNNDEIMGVVEIINKRGREGKFVDEEPVLLQEIADVLGIALSNQQRMDPKVKKSKFAYLLSRDLITEEELKKAREESRAQKEPMETVLMRKYNITKDDIGHSLEDFYQCKYVSFNQKTPIPGDLLKNLNKDYLLRELWVPIQKAPAKQDRANMPHP